MAALLGTLRAVRAHITRAMKAIGLTICPEAKAIPAWWKNGQKRARALAKEVKSDCIQLDFSAPFKRPSVARKTYELDLYQ